jgi:hypothetical protein
MITPPKAQELQWNDGADKRKWVITDNCTVTNWPTEGLTLAEQECILRDDLESGVVYVDCSHRPRLLKLTRNPNFTVNKVLVGSSGRILQASGTLPPKKVRISSYKAL